MIHPTANIWGKTSIGQDTTIGAFADIGGSTVGNGCKIQCHVSIPPGWTIGNRVFIGPGARFANDKHPNLDGTFVPQTGIVEDNVVIGMGALIGAAVTLHKGCKIGMGAVVTKDCEAGKTYVGNPARSMGDS